MPASRIAALIVQSRQTMGWTQREFAEKLGTSLRTAARQESGQSTFYPESVAKLATLVYPVDRDLAVQIVATINQTLVGLGIEAPPPPPAPPPVAVAPAPSRSPVAALRDLVDAIVCAVADQESVAPKVVRPAVLLTLRRAHEVCLSPEIGCLRGGGPGGWSLPGRAVISTGAPWR